MSTKCARYSYDIEINYFRYRCRPIQLYHFEFSPQNEFYIDPWYGYVGATDLFPHSLLTSFLTYSFASVAWYHITMSSELLSTYLKSTPFACPPDGDTILHCRFPSAPFLERRKDWGEFRDTLSLSRFETRTWHNWHWSSVFVRKSREHL